MTGREHHPSRQYRLDLPHQGAQISFCIRVLLQQIRKAPLPAPSQCCADPLEVRTLRYSELLLCLRQPPLHHLDPVRVTASQQLDEPPPGSIPCVGGFAAATTVLPASAASAIRVSASIPAPHPSHVT